MKPLDREFLKKLVKKEELKEVGMTPIFKDAELELIQRTIREGGTKFHMRDREFRVRYFNFKGKPWVTVYPKWNFVPRFSSPVADALKADMI